MLRKLTFDCRNTIDGTRFDGRTCRPWARGFPNPDFEKTHLATHHLQSGLLAGANDVARCNSSSTLSAARRATNSMRTLIHASHWSYADSNAVNV